VSAILSVRGLAAGYGQILAVRDIDIDLEPGLVTVVIGPNGAGKSTLLRAMAGLIPVRAGTIELDGRADPITSLAAFRRVKLGLSLVQQNKRVFRRQTVKDNLVVAAGRLPRGELQSRIEAAYERFPALAEKSDHLAGALSGGQQQMLAIAQALIVQPRVLMLDEPSAGLAPILVRQVMDGARQVASEGVAVLLVEQVLHEALRIADRLYSLRLGELLQDTEFVPGAAQSRHGRDFF
jgi:branched-chain amino acid transport system ATP-binding protein